MPPQQGSPFTLTSLVFICATRLLHALLYEPNPEVLQKAISSVTDIDKPRFDVKKYQFAKLNNNVQVLNVRDPKTLSAGFAVAVDSGLYNDPAAFPGLAHFCEHMLFLGSEKFPTPDGFDDYLSSHGGYSNAYTANEVTVYFAELSQSGVNEGLLRFADMLRAPTFNREYVEKEVHAIDSEHQKNVQDPYDRIFNLMYSLGDSKSPVTTFHTGSLYTLFQKPQQNNEDPVDALIEYFKRRYCANKMHVVTYGPDELHLQYARVVEAFGNLTAGDDACSKNPPASFSAQPPFPQDTLGKFTTAIGTLPQSQLWVHFPLSDYRSARKGQPFDVLDHVFTHGHTGGLQDVLAERLGLISSLWTSYDTSSAGTQMLVVFELTETGRVHPRLVFDVFFGFLASLRRTGITQELCTSLQKVKELRWNLDADSGAYYYFGPSDTAASLAERMTRLPPTEVLTGDSLIAETLIDTVNSIIGELKPANMNIGFVVPPGSQEAANLAASGAMQELPHYRVNYKTQRISDVWTGKAAVWQAWLDHFSETELKDVLRELLPSSLYFGSPALLPVMPGCVDNVPNSTLIDVANMQADAGEDEAGEAFGKAPEDLAFDEQELSTFLLRSSAQSTVTVASSTSQYRPGWMTTSPYAQINLVLRVQEDLTQDPQTSAETTAKVMLFDRLLSKYLAPTMANFALLGVTYSFSVSPTALTITLSGLQDTLGEALQTMVSEFRTMCAKAAEGGAVIQVRLKRAMESLQQELGSFSDMPVAYAKEDRDKLLTVGSVSDAEVRHALQNFKAEDTDLSSKVMNIMHEVSGSLFSKPLAATSLAMGNIGKEKAKLILTEVMQGIKTAVAKLSIRPAISSANNSATVDLAVREVMPVLRPGVPVEVRMPNPRPDDPNDVVTVAILRGVANERLQVEFALLGMVIDTLAFEELRTQQQLGYVVSASTSTISNVNFVSATVQGTHLPADEVEAAIEHFLQEQVPEALSNMSDAEFQQYKEACAERLLEPPRSFSQEMEHFWSSALLSGRCLNQATAKLKALKEFSKAQVVEVWRNLVTPNYGAPEAPEFRRKVVVKYIAGASEVPARPEVEEVHRIWKHHGIKEKAWSRLEKEYQSTMVFNAANRASQQRILGHAKTTTYQTWLKCGDGEDQ